MNWDWEKLQEKKRKGGGPVPPDFEEVGETLRRLRNLKLPGGGKIVILVLVLIWLLSGIYLVQPDEVGVEQRFGAFTVITAPGPHYHLPFPIETVQTPKVTEIRRLEVGFRSTTRSGEYQPGQYRAVPDEALMLTGDENIINVQFIVQYQIKDPVDYLFNLANQAETVKSAAEAGMREVIGKNKIDNALTTGKFEIQNDSVTLLQEMLDRYQAGIRVVAVQLQDVHPPTEVIDAFKDVASAREDKSRFINEAEAYQNDVLPKARGEAAVIVNDAQAYLESKVLKAQGDAARFSSVLAEYKKAPDITRRRLSLETMESVLANPETEKIVLSDEALQKAVPYLPLDRVTRGARGAAEPKPGEAKP
jgi:membrane protease subunit HflK